jgi:hypothetical protein
VFLPIATLKTDFHSLRFLQNLHNLHNSGSLVELSGLKWTENMATVVKLLIIETSHNFTEKTKHLNL